MKDDYKYKYKVKKAINTDGHIYNLMIQAFAGGYTHSNWINTGDIIKNVTSFDFTSSYPYCMVAFDNFPTSEFKKCYCKKESDLWNNLCYLLVVKFKNIKCKYFNNFISLNKCRNVKNARLDNGRIMSADELEITLTEIDFKFILKTYNCEYEIIESYYARKGYLPKQYIEFILDKYIKKTEYKNVEGKEIEYNLEKQLFNSTYGMTVTNNIRDVVIFDNEKGWYEIPLDNTQIIDELNKEKNKSLLSFSWGIYVTSIARNNLLENIIKLDEYLIYADTDSLKLKDGYNIEIINEYNNQVEKRIKKASEDLEIDINKFKPKDIKGKEHMLGLFENETDEKRQYTYDEFITLGAKKYAVKIDDEIKITVSGVPKSGAKALTSLEQFKNDFVFDFKYTNKNLLSYEDEIPYFRLVDYNGISCNVYDRHGCVLIPTTYILGQSDEYKNLLDSSSRSIFSEVKNERFGIY